ncbi:MAG: SIMPL domain-containing protein [Syntrophomonadaceae bacterium]|nr:SIMPL domain-containing protein [Syntrophomonadaceae bacterium]
MQPCKRKPIINVLLTTLLVAFFTLSSCFPGSQTIRAENQVGGTGPTLVVEGTGTVSETPDQAKAALAIVNHDKSLSVAQEQNSAGTNQVIQALIAAGIPSENIETTSFTVWPQYSYPDTKNDNQPPTIIGYKVRNELTIINKIPDLGTALDTALKAGANEVINIQYLKSDTTEATNLALTRACQNAITKSQAIAKALGMQLGEIVTVSEGTISTTPPRTMMLKEAAIGGADSIPIQPGQLEVQSTVTVTFKLK